MFLCSVKHKHISRMKWETSSFLWNCLFRIRNLAFRSLRNQPWNKAMKKKLEIFRDYTVVYTAVYRT